MNAQPEISWHPTDQQFTWRLLFVMALTLGIVSFFLWPLIQYEFLHGHPIIGDLWRVDLNTLGNFEFDEDHGTLANVPARFRELDGKKVALEGFMWTGNSSARNVPSFQFVYKMPTESFEILPIQKRVFVYVDNRSTVQYQTDECRIIGTLHVRVERAPNGGQAVSLYTMDLDHVEPL